MPVEPAASSASYLGEDVPFLPGRQLGFRIGAHQTGRAILDSLEVAPLTRGTAYISGKFVAGKDPRGSSSTSRRVFSNENEQERIEQERIEYL